MPDVWHLGVCTVTVPHGPDGSHTTGPVPVLFRPRFSHLYEWWMRRSRPVQDCRCTFITVIQTGGQVFPKLLRVKFYNFALKSDQSQNLFDHCSLWNSFSCACHLPGCRCVIHLKKQVFSQLVIKTLFSNLKILVMDCIMCQAQSMATVHCYWGQWSYFELDRQATHGVCPLFGQ